MDNVVDFKTKLSEKLTMEKDYGMDDIDEEELEIYVEEFIEDIEELLKLENILAVTANDMDIEFVELDVLDYDNEIGLYEELFDDPLGGDN